MSMTPKCKKRSSYILIGLFYLLGGVEYAVILPTVWLYLTTKFNAPSYFLGLMLSAFTFSGLFANPIMGIVSDRMRNTKVLFLFANLWEIAGNIMYFLGFSAWFLVSSRLVAGVGAGVGSPMTGDITRATTPEERTPLFSVLGAMRQIGLLLGPGFNLFLRSLNFYIGSFIVDKYTSPGLFMAALWLILNVVVLFLYFELPALKSQERLTNEIAYPRRLDSTYLSDSVENISINTALPDNNYFMNEGRTDAAFSNSPVISQKSPVQPRQSSVTSQEIINRGRTNSKHRALVNISKEHDLMTSDEMIESAEIILSNSCPQRALQDRLYHQIEGQPRAKSAPVDLVSSDSQDISDQKRSNKTETKQTPGAAGGDYSSCNGGISSSVEVTPLSNKMRTTDRENVDASTISANREAVDHEACNIDVIQSETDPRVEMRNPHSFSSSGFRIPWRYAIEVFTRHEIIALLAASFIAFFNQVALETMCTPLTERLLGWHELENSIFFCAAGVWILLSFLTLRVLSRRVSDRALLFAGLIMEMSAMSWFLYFVPTAVPGDVRNNLPKMLAGVALDLFGLPFIAITSTSIFSKVTDEETQGFTQGVKGTVQGIGMLLGPLWAGSLLDTTERLYLMLGVMLGLMLLSLVLLLLSWKHMKERNTEVSPVMNVQEEERQPLLSGN